MSLSILLSSGSFFLPQNLTDKIDNNTISDNELDYALSINLISAYHEKLKRAEQGSFIWLRYAQKIAKNDGEMSVSLAKFYLKSKETQKGLYWYRHAIKLGYQPAVMALAQYYFETNRLAKAQELLLNRQNMPTDFILLALKVAIALGDEKAIEQYINKVSKLRSGQKLLAKIAHYQIFPINLSLSQFNYLDPTALITTEMSSSQSCSNSLQFFATTLADLEKITRLKQQYAQLPINRYICLASPRYIPVSKLNCSHNSKSAIRCDESVWRLYAKDINSRYLALMHPFGGANVHLGMLYIDRKDDLNILAHEISHLLGFIDEYPLPKKHATCQKEQASLLSHNIAVLKKVYQGDRAEIRSKILAQIPWGSDIKPSTPILTKTNDINNQNKKDDVSESLWLLGTPNNFEKYLGVFSASTCDNGEIAAFKPLKQRTQLLYYEVDFPKEYLNFLSQKPDAFLMPSFHYNLAMALIRKDQLLEGKYWLLKAAELENNNARKAKVLRGQF